MSPALGYNRFASGREKRAIPFPSHARATDEPELLESQRRRREQGETERPTPQRRPRRRRQSTPWLQRNALSVAAISILVAFLGMGFGLVQMLNRQESAAASMALAQVDTPGPVTLSAASIGQSVPVPPVTDPQAPVADPPGPKPIQANAKVLDANYTVTSGDTLVSIAQRFNTTVARIQAFNGLSDPRALRVGTKLVIPPPLG